MSTNYYLQQDEKQIHIGKSSVGWCFGLHVYPDQNINDLKDWIELFKKYPIKNEYKDNIKSRDMQSIIVDRCRHKNWDSDWWDVSGHYKSEKDFHRQNYSQRGPRGLLRHQLGEFCIRHGVGTWDCLVGDFS